MNKNKRREKILECGLMINAILMFMKRTTNTQESINQMKN